MNSAEERTLRRCIVARAKRSVRVHSAYNMSVGEAERVNRRRERDARARAHASYVETQRKQGVAGMQRRDALLAQVDKLAPQALAALRRAGWPDAKMIRCQSGLFHRKLAGWPVSWIGHGANSKLDITQHANAELYLLSNGRFATVINGYQPRSFRGMVNHPPGNIRPKWDDNQDSEYSDVPNALHAIIAKYGQP